MPTKSHESLRELLAKLHAELAAAPRIDPALRQPLREVLADIERVVEHTPEAQGKPGAVGAGRSVPRLEVLAIDFEAEHPGLAGTLRQLVTLLGQAGL